jgi:chromosome segregation ATPase
VSNDSGLRERVETLGGEVAGLRARVLEAETAWRLAHASSQKLQQRMGSVQARVDELRSESAELKLLAETRAARIAELTHASGVDQQELRALRAQVSSATAAQVAHNEARETDRQLWSERFSQQEAREQAAWKAASEAVARSESRLREFLVSLEQPLQELDGALDALNTTQTAPEQRAPKKASGRASKAARAAQPAEEPATAQRLKNNSAEE